MVDLGYPLAMLQHMSTGGDSWAHNVRVKLFRNGRNQAVRIPRECELASEKAILRKQGERVIIEPAPPRSLLAVLATLESINEAFPPIPELPTKSVDL